MVGEPLMEIFPPLLVPESSSIPALNLIALLDKWWSDLRRDIVISIDSKGPAPELMDY